MSTENMNTTVAETAAVTPAEKGDNKTFTQDDVNRIVQDRLAKDRAKAAEELSKKEQELAQREFRLNSRQKVIDRGYPESLIDALNCTSDEAFNKALDAIDSLIKERTPDKHQQELEANRARFTTVESHHGGGFFSKPDPIRKAMNLTND